MKKAFLANGVLLIILSLTFITPTNAATIWGIEADVEYEFELKSFKIGITDYSAILKENVSFIVEFTSLTDIGYSYDVYNSTGLMTTNTTNFLETEVELVTVTLPDGLPIALPLAIGTIPDYLDYFGDFVNATSSMSIFEDLVVNVTEFLNITYMYSYSQLNENYLILKTDLFAPTVNETVLEALTGETGGFMPLPTNITDLKLNATIAYNATSGLFKQLSIKIRSLSHIGDFTEDFNVDVVYGLHVEEVVIPTPTPTPTPTDDTSYSWFIPTVLVLTLLTSIKLKRKKQ
ncbi:MAG: hypothetical protein ACFFDS_00105 [Candidatus Thorarchaeota archaeon]